MFAALTLLFATATTVLGHGYVEKVVTSSGTYSGYLPYQDPYMSPAPERIIRKIPGNGPVEDVASIDIQCNGWSAGNVTGSAPAAAVAVAAAGTDVALTWTTWPDSHMGPIITYMARAPSDITAWSPGSDAVWFKVDEQGYVDGKWAATDILTGENNSVYTFKIPASLKAGQYIIRHEIIALHAAYAYPGAQFYPSCIQVEVTGSGTETGPSELVAFPGAYTADTPGIVFDAYKTGVEYPIPGPAVWTGGAGSSTPATSTATAAGTSKAVASSSTAVASSSSAAASTSTTAANTSTTAAGTSTAAAPVTTSVAPAATSTTAAAPATTTAAVNETAAKYAQCGGRTYTGPTTCVSGSTCNFVNEYYSQCV